VLGWLCFAYTVCMFVTFAEVGEDVGGVGMD
jgi:hypothetical protein